MYIEPLYDDLSDQNPDSLLFKVAVRARLEILRQAVEKMLDDCDPDKDHPSQVARYTLYEDEERSETRMSEMAISIEKLIEWAGTALN